MTSETIKHNTARHYSLLSLAIVFLGLPLWANADDFCKRKPVDPESPPGFAGTYDVIGKDPITGTAYAGTLTIGFQKTSYSLVRAINGKVVRGEAWIEECGMDKLVVLAAHYNFKQAVELTCALSADADNYYRMTCRTRNKEQPPTGLEAWFQKQ